MAMELHGASRCDMDHSLGSVLVFFTIHDREFIYFYLFVLSFSSCVLILFFNVL
jgi:hypothetical protein